MYCITKQNNYSNYGYCSSELIKTDKQGQTSSLVTSEVYIELNRNYYQLYCGDNLRKMTLAQGNYADLKETVEHLNKRGLPAPDYVVTGDTKTPFEVYIRRNKLDSSIINEDGLVIRSFDVSVIRTDDTTSIGIIETITDDLVVAEHSLFNGGKLTNYDIFMKVNEHITSIITSDEFAEVRVYNVSKPTLNFSDNHNVKFKTSTLKQGGYFCTQKLAKQAVKDKASSATQIYDLTNY
ncbi:hypothetical protein [Oceanobacillus kimchii]|uniref:hypothetical protein n=1 Tax=Oceanobacillus kimchii TaxID=746691 RepID=UPI003B016B4D